MLDFDQNYNFNLFPLVLASNSLIFIVILHPNQKTTNQKHLETFQPYLSNYQY